MKSWLAQGRSSRWVTLLPGTTFLHINGALEAETSVSNLTQHKLFIGDNKKNTLFGVTFSLSNKLGLQNSDASTAHFH